MVRKIGEYAVDKGYVFYLGVREIALDAEEFQALEGLMKRAREVTNIGVRNATFALPNKRAGK